MMNEVPTAQFAKESFLLVIASDALKLFNFNIKLFALYNVPSSVFTEVTRQRGSQEVKELPF